MKITALIITLVLITRTAFSQAVEISVSPTINNAFYNKPLIGAPSHNPHTGLSAGLKYNHNADKKLSLSYGINYQLSRVEIDPFIDPFHDPLPYTATVSLFSIVLDATLKLKNQFYLNLGPTFDLQLKYNPKKSIADQTGIGLSAGLGKKIKITESLYFNIEPKLWIHNIISMQETYPLRLTTGGINLGLVFGK